MIFRAVWFLLLVTPCLRAGAQWEFGFQEDDYFRRNLFGSKGAVCLLDFSPTQVHHHIISDGLATPIFVAHSYTPITGMMFNREYRLNILNYSDKGSLSISSSAFIGLSYFVPNRYVQPEVDWSYSDYWNDQGAFAFRFPFMLQWNQGYLSTYNNIDKFGFHVAYGRQYNMTPLFIFNPIDIEDWRKISKQSVVEDNLWYWNNILRLGMKWETANLSGMGIDLYIGFGKPSLWNAGKMSRFNQFTLVVSGPFIEYKEWRMDYDVY